MLDMERMMRQPLPSSYERQIAGGSDHSPQPEQSLKKLANGEAEPKQIFPSPPASNTRGKVVPTSKASLLEAGDSKPIHEPYQDPPPVQASPKIPRSQSGLNREGKRSREAEDSTVPITEEPAEKRMRVASPEGIAPITSAKAAPAIDESREQDSKTCNPIKYWAETGNWPRQYLDMDPSQIPLSSKKRSHSVSWTQSVKDGTKPKAYTPKYEDSLAIAGIYMSLHQRQAAISSESQEFCKDLLKGDYDPPAGLPFHGDWLWKTLDRVRIRNEARVSRDITPSLVPSAEMLYIQGQDHLEDVSEELNTSWIKCNSLAGPQPKPDFCVGLMSSAFTEDELLKLQLYTAPNRATMVTEHLYFPFLMCEVKCGEQGLARADRQNAHSSSLAVNAIIQLHRASSRAADLDRKVLAFSISHDHIMVKIYGHYAVIEDEKVGFYRHLMRSIDLNIFDDRWTAYNFTRSVYDKFVPLHLERIRSALAALPDIPPPSSPESEADADSAVAEGQEARTAPPSSSWDADGFRRPVLPLSVTLQQELEMQQQKSAKQQEELEMQQQVSAKQQQESAKQQQELEKQRQDAVKQQQVSAKQQQELDEIKAQNERLLKLLGERVAGQN